jgi:hypothetical protein
LTQQATTLSGQRLNNSLRKLGSEKAMALFGRDGVEGLEDIAALAERVRPENANRVAGGLIAAGVNASILAPILRPLGVNFGSLGYSATATVGINLLARVLTKPHGLVTYRRFLRGLSTGNRPLAMAAGLRLSAQVQAEQNDLNDLTKVGTTAQPPRPVQPGVVR